VAVFLANCQKKFGRLRLVPKSGLSAELLGTPIVVVALACATVLSRLPFLAPRLAHWDAVNYALGLHDFNVAAHQPHPPGSPYFILLGRLALAVTADDNAALILVSLVASVGAVIGEYVLASMLFGRRAGLFAALVLMTQPAFWGYGTIATAWTLLACLSLGIGLLCAAMLRGARRLAIPSAAVLGLVSGFRLDLSVFLAPLLLFGVWRVEPRPRRRLLAVALIAMGVALWLIPVAVSTDGGVNGWWGRLLALLPDNSQGAVARQFTSNTQISFGTLTYTLGPTLVLAILCNRRAAGRWLHATFRSQLGVFWIAWIAPAFVFLWLVDSTEPGHALVFVVAVCALGVGALVHAARSLRQLLVCGGALMVAQAAVFLFSAPTTSAVLAGTLDSMLLKVTAPGLRQHQSSLEAALGAIRTEFDPADTVVLTMTGQDPYRFMMYYLPDFLVLRLDPQAHAVLAARDRQQGHWQEATGCLIDSAATRNLVWVLSPDSDLRLVPRGARHVSVADGGPFDVWAQQLGSDKLNYAGFTSGGSCDAGAPST
jgi:Dolichyl-phosphate-mannose-protein mannosyltransferase